MSLHVERYGDGPRVVFAVHGWGGDHREFAAVAARRPPGAALLSVDLPGHGASPAPDRWSLERIVGQLVRRVEEEDLRGVVFAGFCSGAVLALMCAASCRDRAARLVMIDPFTYVPLYFRLFTWGWFGRQAYRTAFASGFGRRATNRVLRSRQGTGDDFTAAFRRLDPAVTLRYLALFARCGPLDRFAGLGLPVDLLHGERTFAAVRRSVAGLRRLWPRARVQVLGGTGHLTMVRGAPRIARVLFGS